jgi:CubicO group peptidase (beta-lactamase class C family)
LTTFLLLLALFCIPATAQADSTPALSQDDHAVLKELEEYVHQTAVALGNCPSAIVVSRNGEILFEKYAAGIDGAAPQGPVDARSLWQIFSMTKSYASGLVLSLAKDGTLTLDDPVSEYLPEFSTHGDGAHDRRAVTIRHLMSHTSGADLPKEAWSDDPPDLTQLRTQTPPGETFRYSGLGMHVLERTVEAAAGADFEELLKARILEPMGLRDTRYLYELDPSLPMLPVGNAQVDDPTENYALAHKGHRAGYGLYATARDCNRFGSSWLGDGTFEGHTFFTPELKRQVWTYHGMRNSDKGRYGLLWWLFEDDGGYVISGAGAKATAVVPETGVVITVLRLPLEPGNGPFHFKADKQMLVQFGKRLGK